MITIVKDKNKIICSRQTYEDQYKALGYRPVEDKETTKKVVSDVKEKVEEDTIEVEDKNKSEVTEEDKLKEKYGVGRRNSRKKEED